MKRAIALFVAMSIAATALAMQTAPARHPDPGRSTQPTLTPEQQSLLSDWFHLPPGTTAKVTITNTSEQNEGSRQTTETASGQGAKLDARGDKVATDFNAGAPGANLGKDTASASGGDTDADASALAFKAPSISHPLTIAGILLILGAGVAIYVGARRAAFIAGAVGVFMLAAAAFPALMLWLVLGGVAVLGGAYVWAEHHGKSMKEAGRAVLAAVDDLGTDAKRSFTTRLAKHAEPRDVRAIDSIQKLDELDKYKRVGAGGGEE